MIADKFETDTCVAIEQSRPDLPVFKIKSETSDREMVLHRNRLLLMKGREGEARLEEENAILTKRL